jgi:mono/diheme cytochrome c family protein
MMRVQTLLSGAFILAVAVSGCRNSPGYPKPEADVLRPENQLNFDALYKQNCSACHGGEGKNGAAIDLANPEYQALVDDESLKGWIGGGMTGTQMPAFAIWAGGALTNVQINVIVRGMRQNWLRSGVLGGAKPPKYKQDGSGEVLRGRRSYEIYCAPCHKASKQQVTSPDYLALVSNQALRSIVIAGRPDIGHPDWRNDKPGTPLNEDDVTDIVAFLASLRSPTPGQPYRQDP